MTSSHSKGERQVLLNEAWAKRFKFFPFGCAEIETETKAKYFGVVISAKSTLQEILTKLFKAARATMTSLERRKMLFPGINATFATMLFCSPLRRNIEYRCFLCPCEGVGQNAFNALLRRFLVCVVGIHVRISQLPHLIPMFISDTWGVRRGMPPTSFMKLLKGLHDDDKTKRRQRWHANNSLLSLRAVGPFRKRVYLRRDLLTKAKSVILKRKYRENIQKYAKPPFPAASCFFFDLQLQGRSRKLACRWHLDTFSMHYRFLQRIGLLVHLDDPNLLKLILKKRRPSKIEWVKIRAALDDVDSIPEDSILLNIIDSPWNSNVPGILLPRRWF